MSKFTLKLGLVAAATLGTTALAQDHEPQPFTTCEQAGVGLDSLAIGNNGKGVQTYYEGAVLMMQIDMIEPSARSSGLVILMTDLNEPMAPRQCLTSQLYSYVDVDAATSSYDPATGLTVTVPAMDYDGMMSVPGKPLKITIDVGKATIKAVR